MQGIPYTSVTNRKLCVASVLQQLPFPTACHINECITVKCLGYHAGQHSRWLPATLSKQLHRAQIPADRKTNGESFSLISVDGDDCQVSLVKTWFTFPFPESCVPNTGYVSRLKQWTMLLYSVTTPRIKRNSALALPRSRLEFYHKDNAHIL